MAELDDVAIDWPEPEVNAADAARAQHAFALLLAETAAEIAVCITGRPKQQDQHAA